MQPTIRCTSLRTSWYRAETAQRRFRGHKVAVTCRPITCVCPTASAMIPTLWAASFTQRPAQIRHTARRSARSTAVSDSFLYVFSSTHNSLLKLSTLAQHPSHGCGLTVQPHVGDRADVNQLDVIYDSNDKIWRCCSTNPNGDSNCSHIGDSGISLAISLSMSNGAQGISRWLSY